MKKEEIKEPTQKMKLEEGETRPSRPIRAPCGSSNECVTNQPTDGQSLLLTCVGARKDVTERASKYTQILDPLQRGLSVDSLTQTMTVLPIFETGSNIRETHLIGIAH